MRQYIPGGSPVSSGGVVEPPKRPGDAYYIIYMPTRYQGIYACKTKTDLCFHLNSGCDNIFCKRTATFSEAVRYHRGRFPGVPVPTTPIVLPRVPEA